MKINQIYKASLLNLSNTNSLRSNIIFERKFEHDYLIQKYSEFADTPIEILENLDLSNEELFDIVKKYDPRLQTEEVHKEILVNSELENTSMNLRNFLGENESELSLNIKKLATNAKFIFSTLYLACEGQETISIDRILAVFVVLGETLHIKLTKDVLKNLGKIFNAYSNGEITLNPFFKNLRIHMKRLFPNFFTPVITENINNIEMHENLLLNSQTFKNFIDEDEERDLAYTSFTIRTMYSRAKSTRPVTGKKDQYNNLDDIPESKDEFIDKNNLLDSGNEVSKMKKKNASDKVNEDPKNHEKKPFLNELDRSKATKGEEKQTIKDLSTGDQQQVNNENLQTDGNPVVSEKKNTDGLESKDLESVPNNNANETEHNVFNNHDIRSGPNIMSESEKLPEEIHNDNESQLKQLTDEKVNPLNEDTV